MSAIRRHCQKPTNFRGLPMSSTFDTVANIISETCDIEREKITPDSHAIDDLGIDSLDFLDVAFAIDKAFGIKLPLEQWTQEANDGKATPDQNFLLKNLCSRLRPPRGQREGKQPGRTGRRVWFARESPPPPPAGVGRAGGSRYF